MTGWLVLGGVLAALAVLYGVAQRRRGRAEERARQAEDDHAAWERVGEQISRGRDRDDVRRWLRRASADEPDPGP